MKNTFALITCMVLGLTLQAQIGITAGYTQASVPAWDQQVQQIYGADNQVFRDGTRIGINYWLPLKNIRIEFLPSIEFAAFGSSHPGGVAVEVGDREYRANLIGVFLNTRIYPFNMQGDCTCPTFSKGGDLLEKGLFIMLSPGVERFKTDYTIIQEDGNQRMENKEWRPSIGGSVGLDIGLSELITLTPILGVKYSTAIDGDHLMDNETLGDDQTNWLQLFGGIHVGLRFKR